MTDDELQTRLLRLESRQQVVDALLHSVLPAIDPERRPVVLRQFAQYCRAMETKAIAHQDAPEARQHLNLLAEAYTRLEGALELIAETEKRTGRPAWLLAPAKREGS